VCLKKDRPEIQTLCFPRVFADAKANNWGLNNHRIYGIEGDRFYVGEESLPYQDSFIRHDYRVYVKDKIYWLCICKALTDLGIFKDNDNVRIKRLILGLAPGHYSQGNITHMKRKSLQGVEFAASNKWHRFFVENVKILPQGSGTFFAETLTDSGLIKEKNGYKKLYDILNVGYRTTDFLVFEKGQFIGEKEELSEDTGMRTVLENL
jgi:plasmid segregation protein ParM